MRMYVASAEKYFQKSLRTKNYLSAKEKAQIEHAKILVNKQEGKANIKAVEKGTFGVGH